MASNNYEKDKRDYTEMDETTENSDGGAQMNNRYPTRSGIQPADQELPFDISTSQVEDYIQRKLNVVVNGMRRNGLYKGNDIDVRVITVEMGSKFVPFTVVLPMSVLKERKNRQKDELDIFNPKDRDETANLYDPIMRMFSSYLYNKEDGEAFYSPDWRRERGVSTTTSAVLKRNRLPKVQKLNNGSMEAITFLIDPIRVFYDMLIMENNTSNFHIEIRNWQKIRSGEFKYEVKRVINKKKGKKGNGSNNLADEVNRKMRGFNK